MVEKMCMAIAHSGLTLDIIIIIIIIIIINKKKEKEAKLNRW